MSVCGGWAAKQKVGETQGTPDIVRGLASPLVPGAFNQAGIFNHPKGPAPGCFNQGDL